MMGLPSIITNYKFCLDRVNDGLKDIAILGSQGPDPFFFAAGDFKFSKNYTLFGSAMHRMDPYEMYKYMIEYASLRVGRERDILFSFIRGLMYHYCVDRRCHPYVFYKTGFKTEENKGKIKFGISHSALETYIDVLLSEKYDIKIKPWEALKASDEQVQLVSVMIYKFGKNILKDTKMDSSAYYECVKGFRRLEHMLYSPRGIKKTIYRILCRRTSLNTLCMPKEVKNNDKLDCLNEKKETWLEPDSGNKRNESFYELLGYASKDDDIVDEILKDAYEGRSYQNKLKEFTSGINHHGLKEEDSKKYYSLIWNKLKK